MKREDEQSCSLIFSEHLSNNNPGKDIKWVDVDQTNEPPDYYLWVDNNKYAVEITTLVEYLLITKNKTLPLFSCVKALQDLVKTIEQVSTDKGTLKGIYCICFGEPFKNYGKIKASLNTKLLDYIYYTQDQADVAEEFLYYDWGNHYCSITKVGISENRIQMLGPTGAKFVSGIETEVQTLLKEILLDKSKKLSHVKYPHILIIRDNFGYKEYGLSNATIREKIKLDTPELELFHSIFIVDAEDNGFILKSEKSIV